MDIADRLTFGLEALWRFFARLALFFGKKVFVPPKVAAATLQNQGAKTTKKKLASLFKGKQALLVPQDDIIRTILRVMLVAEGASAIEINEVLAADAVPAPPSRRRREISS